MFNNLLFFQAAEAVQPDASVIYVPPQRAAQAIMDAIDAEIGEILADTASLSVECKTCTFHLKSIRKSYSRGWLSVHQSP